jgi:SHS2 domain-containing protein
VSPFETFEHTADVGLRIRAARLADLFAEAGRGFLALLVEDPETVREEREVRIEVEADGLENLLLDWLSELLYRFETEHLLLGRFEVSVEGSRLEATARGERWDPERHELGQEVKAVTYHDLRVERGEDGWEAQVILDI